MNPSILRTERGQRRSNENVHVRSLIQLNKLTYDSQGLLVGPLNGRHSGNYNKFVKPGSGQVHLYALFSPFLMHLLLFMLCAKF